MDAINIFSAANREAGSTFARAVGSMATAMFIYDLRTKGRTGVTTAAAVPVHSSTCRRTREDVRGVPSAAIFVCPSVRECRLSGTRQL